MTEREERYYERAGMLFTLLFTIWVDYKFDPPVNAIHRAWERYLKNDLHKKFS